MASYTKDTSDLLQKLAAADLGKLQSLHIRVERFHSRFFKKQPAHVARLLGDTACLADLAAANVQLLQLVSRHTSQVICSGNGE
jgi:hypothetical protein